MAHAAARPERGAVEAASIPFGSLVAVGAAARVDDGFEWERTLEGGGLFGDRNARTVVKEAVGVVAAVTPSNFPIEVILNKLGPALATGNTVVLKPDPNTRGTPPGLAV
jgi:aldehyde dehydrogenase (NAD+)